MLKVSGYRLLNLFPLTRAFIAEMAMTAGALIEQRRISRLKAHLDWREGAQRNKQMRR
jgi:hypothetical protein